MLYSFYMCNNVCRFYGFNYCLYTKALLRILSGPYLSLLLSIDLFSKMHFKVSRPTEKPLSLIAHSSSSLSLIEWIQDPFKNCNLNKEPPFSVYITFHTYSNFIYGQVYILNLSTICTYFFLF